MRGRTHCGVINSPTYMPSKWSHRGAPETPAWQRVTHRRQSRASPRRVRYLPYFTLPPTEPCHGGLPSTVYIHRAGAMPGQAPERRRRCTGSTTTRRPCAALTGAFRTPRRWCVRAGGTQTARCSGKLQACMVQAGQRASVSRKCAGRGSTVEGLGRVPHRRTGNDVPPSIRTATHRRRSSRRRSL